MRKTFYMLILVTRLLVFHGDIVDLKNCPQREAAFATVMADGWVETAGEAVNKLQRLFKGRRHVKARTMATGTRG